MTNLNSKYTLRTYVNKAMRIEALKDVLNLFLRQWVLPSQVVWKEHHIIVIDRMKSWKQLGKKADIQNS